jgi:hypothetical protein
MPNNTKLPGAIVQTPGFTGGANSRDALNLMQPNEARPIENITFDERGGATKRRGCKLLGTFGGTGARVLSMYTFDRGSLFIPQVLIHTSEGILYYTTNPDASPPTWTQITTGLSTTAPMCFETFKSWVYMSNGVDNYCKWSGSAYATIASAPKGRYLKLWKEMMWVAGVVGLDDRVYRSNPGDPDTFDAVNWSDVAQGDGDVVMALANDGQYLVVGKRDMTFTFYDAFNMFWRIVDPEKGFESHFGVAEFEGDLFFLSRRGICQYLGDAPSMVLSEKIDPLFTAEMMALDKLTKSRCYTFLNRIGWVIPESDGNNLIVEYYPRLGAYNTAGIRQGGPFSFHRMPVQDFTRWRWATKDMLVAGHNAANKFLEMFAPVGTDDGAPYQGVLQTAWFNFNDPLNTKYIHEMRFLCAGRFQVLVYRNLETTVYRTLLIDARGDSDDWDSTDLWGQGNWGKQDPVQDILRTNLDAYGRWFSFRFVDANETDTNIQTFWLGSHAREIPVGEWAIYGMTAEASVLGRRS